MNPLLFAVYVVCACIVGCSFVAAYLLFRELLEEKRAEQVADDFLADLDARIAPHLWQQGQAVEDSAEYEAWLRGGSRG